MISINRSDIGAAIASNGEGSYIFVLETALQTNSGKMQYDDYPTLTAIAMDKVAVYGDATQAAQSLLVPQYIMPVVRATARPDGDVIHEVKNGQSLWSIAIEYGGKIEQIRQLNNLSSTDIHPGQKLLVQKGATQQSIPTSNVTETHVAPMTSTPQPPVQLQTPTPQPTEENSTTDQKANTFSFGTIAFAALFLGGMFTAITKKKRD
jgi:LysM repeat protein